jgi:hypothetical protein
VPAAFDDEGNGVDADVREDGGDVGGDGGLDDAGLYAD